MLNVWCGVNPARLKDEWILLEHGEIHEVVRILNDEDNIEQVPDAIKFLGRTGYLKRRHDLIVKEMTRRGIGHHTPVTLSDVPEDDEWVGDNELETVEKMVQELSEKKAFNDLEFPIIL